MRTPLVLLLPLLLTGCNRDALTLPTFDGGAGGDLAGVETFVPAGTYVSRDCAPNDGPALRLLLYTFPIPECSADPGRRSLDVYLYSGGDAVLPVTAPATITSTATRVNGSVTDCPGAPAACRHSSDFTVTFDAFSDKGPAKGRVTARFPDGDVSAAFDATFCEFAPPLCG